MEPANCFISTSYRLPYEIVARLAPNMRSTCGMTVRISKTTDGRPIVIRVDGHLVSEDIPELDKECRSIEGPLLLDLSGLLSADESGVTRIRELAQQGAKLRGTSHYVQMLLDDTEST
jgi:hypothetical protein